MSDIAAAEAPIGWSAVIDLTVEEQDGLGGIFFIARRTISRCQMRQPWMKFGTDAGGRIPSERAA